jgi:hypothetical protein
MKEKINLGTFKIIIFWFQMEYPVNALTHSLMVISKINWLLARCREVGHVLIKPMK